MDAFHWLTVLTLLGIYLGFAGTWGSLLRSAGKGWLAPCYFVFLLLPASLMLPYPDPWREITWAVGLILILLYARIPRLMPVWLQKQVFIFSYYGTLMFLILIWSTMSGKPGLGLALGLPAALAGLASWLRSISYGWGSGLVKKTNGVFG